MIGWKWFQLSLSVLYMCLCVSFVLVLVGWTWEIYQQNHHCGHNFVNAEGQAVIVGGGSLRYLMEGLSDEIHSSSFSSVKTLGSSPCCVSYSAILQASLHSL